MSGGNRQLVINTRERAVSSDHNRLQAFQALERSEVLRYFGLLRGTTLASDVFTMEDGSYIDTSAAATAAITTPAQGDVLEGLVVFPVAGTLNILVSPGMVLLNDPDGQAGSSVPSPPSTDDSRAKLILDPGVQVSGALSFAAGAGSTRIDLVEVRRQTVVLETDSRDIFDPSTGTFLPVTVTKVSEGRLIYRITQGTPGGGIPARSQGWLPICVASIPSTAVNTDTMTFWDVRPLVKDRINAPFESRHATEYLEKTLAGYADNLTTPGQTNVNIFASSQIGMYRAGGSIVLDAQAAANQEPGFAPADGQPWYVYAVFPASLPRWVKYAASPPRVPNGPLGVLTVSSVGPGGTGGGNAFNNSILPPTSTGLGVAGPAAHLAAAPYTTEPGGFIAQEGLFQFNTGEEIVVNAASSTATSDFYNLTANTHFPSPARALVLQVSASFSGAAGSDNPIYCSIFLLKGGTTSPRYCQLGVLRFNNIMQSIGSFIVIYWLEIPRLSFHASPNVSFEVAWGSTVTRTGPQIRVNGWRL